MNVFASIPTTIAKSLLLLDQVKLWDYTLMTRSSGLAENEQ